MDQSHAPFAVAHPLFYDLPPVSGGASVLRPASGVDWTRWQRTDSAVWITWHPPATTLPRQGWKIHVAATVATIGPVLRAVSGYCGRRGIPFKHLRDLGAVRAANAKEAPRSASGKNITIYPHDPSELQTILIELDAEIGGTPGPTVLSDLRWNEGPLAVRYGAFTAEWARDAVGRRVLSLRTPEEVSVEDRRDAGFCPPDWVVMPDFLQHQLDRLGDGRPPAGFGYSDIRPLHYSNAGGVYAARDHTGQPVVLKEARPHAGFTPDGRDAVQRLRDEEQRLLSLAGPGIVAVRGSFELHEHRFLVLAHGGPSTLQQEVTARTPTIRANATASDYLVYRQWALGVADRLDAILARVHAAAVTHGDLHPGNVLIADDGDITLIDFELSRPFNDPATVLCGAPGYVATDGRTGAEADLYALSCIKLSLFCPLTTLLTLDAQKADDLLDDVRERFALDDHWIDGLRVHLRGSTAEGERPTSALTRDADAVLRRWDVRSDDGMLGIHVMIGRSLNAAVDYARGDRAWPGDPAQFPDNGYGLAHGAAGVIHARAASGLGVDPVGWEWLDGAVDAALAGEQGPRLGLYDGLAGVIWLARHLDEHPRANRLLAELTAADHERLDDDLYGGLAGVGLLYLSERQAAGVADRDAAVLLQRATHIADTLRERRDARARGSLSQPPSEDAPLRHTGRKGLMWGPSGCALFATRLFEATRDDDHLRLAIAFLDEDLAHCQTAPDGSLQLLDGRRLLPYLASGSTGIGLVAAQLARHTHDPDRYLRVVEAVTMAALAPFALEPGLFQGRAGLIHALIAFDRCGLLPAHAGDGLDRHLAALQLHAVRHGAGIAFPGRQLLRLSCDLATGSAGVLTALQAYSAHCFGDDDSQTDALIPLVLPSRRGRPSPAEAVIDRVATERR